jgi:transcriptional regulator with XRE-family HTH domain
LTIALAAIGRSYSIRYDLPMDAPLILRDTRRRAGLSQTALAARAGTSQATVSAYENGRKQPSVATLARLLAAAGARLTVEHSPARIGPSAAEQRRAGRVLLDVLALAEALPTRHERELRYPRIHQRAREE